MLVKVKRRWVRMRSGLIMCPYTWSIDNFQFTSWPRQSIKPDCPSGSKYNLVSVGGGGGVENSQVSTLEWVSRHGCQWKCAALQATKVCVFLFRLCLCCISMKNSVDKCRVSAPGLWDCRLESTQQPCLMLIIQILELKYQTVPECSSWKNN